MAGVLGMIGVLNRWKKKRSEAEVDWLSQRNRELIIQQLLIDYIRLEH